MNSASSSAIRTALVQFQACPDLVIDELDRSTNPMNASLSVCSGWHAAVNSSLPEA